VFILNNWWDLIKASADIEIQNHIKSTWMTGTVKVGKGLVQFLPGDKGPIAESRGPVGHSIRQRQSKEPRPAQTILAEIRENSLWNNGEAWLLVIIIKGKDKYDANLISSTGSETGGDKHAAAYELLGGSLSEDTIHEKQNGNSVMIQTWITNMYNKYFGIQGHNRWFDEGPGDEEE